VKIEGTKVDPVVDCVYLPCPQIFRRKPGVGLCLDMLVYHEQLGLGIVTDTKPKEGSDAVTVHFIGYAPGVFVLPAGLVEVEIDQEEWRKFIHGELKENKKED